MRGCTGDGSFFGGGTTFLGESKSLRCSLGGSRLALVVGEGWGENLILDSDRRAGRTLCRLVLGASQAFPRSSCSCLVINGEEVSPVSGLFAIGTGEGISRRSARHMQSHTWRSLRHDI
jgi:hypothetical protein